MKRPRKRALWVDSLFKEPEKPPKGGTAKRFFQSYAHALTGLISKAAPLALQNTKTAHGPKAAHKLL